MNPLSPDQVRRRTRMTKIVGKFPTIFNSSSLLKGKNESFLRQKDILTTSPIFKGKNMDKSKSDSHLPSAISSSNFDIEEHSINQLDPFPKIDRRQTEILKELLDEQKNRVNEQAYLAAQLTKKLNHRIEESKNVVNRTHAELNSVNKEFDNFMAGTGWYNKKKRRDKGKSRYSQKTERQSMKLSEMKFVSGQIGKNSFMTRIAKNLKLKTQRRLSLKKTDGQDIYSDKSISPVRRGSLSMHTLMDPKQNLTIGQKIGRDLQEVHREVIKSRERTTPGNSSRGASKRSMRSMEDLVGKAVKVKERTNSRGDDTNLDMSFDHDGGNILGDTVDTEENDLGLRQRVKQQADMHFHDLQRKNHANMLKEQMKAVTEEYASRDIKNLPRYNVVTVSDSFFNSNPKDRHTPMNWVEFGGKQKPCRFLHRVPFQFDTKLLLNFVLSNISLEFLTEHDLQKRTKYRDHRFRRYSNQFSSYLSMVPNYSSHRNCFRALHEMMLHEDVQELLANVYWFCYLRLFQQHSNFQMLLVLDVIADLYFDIIRDFAASERMRQHKDMFFTFMPYIISEAVFQGFIALCPVSRSLFTLSVKQFVYMDVCELLSGTRICTESVVRIRTNLFLANGTLETEHEAHLMEEFDDLSFAQVVGMAVHAAGMDISTMTPSPSRPSSTASSLAPSPQTIPGSAAPSPRVSTPIVISLEEGKISLPPPQLISSVDNSSHLLKKLITKWSHFNDFLHHGGALRKPDEEGSDLPLSSKLKSRQRQSHVQSRYTSLLLIHCTEKGKIHHLSNMNQQIKRTFPSAKCKVGGLHTYSAPIINRVPHDKWMTNTNLGIQRKNEELRRIRVKFEQAKVQHQKFSHKVLKSGKHGISKYCLKYMTDAEKEQAEKSKRLRLHRAGY